MSKEGEQSTNQGQPVEQGTKLPEGMKAVVPWGHDENGNPIYRRVISRDPKKRVRYLQELGY